ncbi:hypothetical protein [Streptomyces sp. NPDC093089]|uniref:hypothetical protein n=1 Tax=Streptomyces sp. NPDC093089 TaxID=3366024 RepID=UPI0037F9145F
MAAPEFPAASSPPSTTFVRKGFMSFCRRASWESPPGLDVPHLMLWDGGVVRRKKVRKQRPSFGVPAEILLMVTSTGWVSSFRTVEGGLVCGRLDLPVHADPQDARDRAAANVAAVTRAVHGFDVEVTWEEPLEPWAWNARVARVAAKGSPPEEN